MNNIINEKIRIKKDLESLHDKLLIQHEMLPNDVYKNWNTQVIKLVKSELVKIEEYLNKHKTILSCEKCGSLMIHDGLCIMTNPPQYSHKCTNEECNYNMNYSNIYHG